MKSLILKSLLVAALIGPIITFVFAVAYSRSSIRYEPGISESEFKSYDNRTLSDLQALLKSREVKLTRYQTLRDSMGYAYFWKGIVRSSLPSSIAVFLACIIIGTWDSRAHLTANLFLKPLIHGRGGRLKRYWGRLLWVTITNATICVSSIYTVLDVRQEQIRIFTDRPPIPALWSVFYDNPHFAFALVLTVAGLLLEAMNRSEAALINCGFWLALSIYTITQGEPVFAKVVVGAVLAIDVLWYVLPVWRKGTENSRFDSSGS